MKSMLIVLALGGVAAAETGPDFVAAKSPAPEHKSLVASDARNPIEPTDIVAFDNDSAGLREDALDQIDHAATWLAAHPGYNLVLEGHTDTVGANAYNATLAFDRAAAVRSRLQARGVTPDRIVLAAYGETGATQPNNANDRRVVMWATKLATDQVAGDLQHRGALRTAYSAHGSSFDMPARQ